MRKKEAKELMVVIHSQEPLLTLEQVCDICALSAEFIQALVENDIIHPQGSSTKTWRFTLEDIKRIRSAYRLQSDLGVNVEALPIIFDLLDQMHTLRRRMALIEKHFFRL